MSMNFNDAAKLTKTGYSVGKSSGLSISDTAKVVKKGYDLGKSSGLSAHETAEVAKTGYSLSKSSGLSVNDTRKLAETGYHLSNSGISIDKSAKLAEKSCDLGQSSLPGDSTLKLTANSCMFDKSNEHSINNTTKGSSYLSLASSMTGSSWSENSPDLSAYHDGTSNKAFPLMAGTVVKCIYDFNGEVASDLDLTVGDLVKITKVLNEEWCEGICNGIKGNFPVVFVEDTNDVFDVAIAVASFDGEQDGDLPLVPGDYIVISEVIDESWLRGIKQGGQEGMFPKAFIKYISFDKQSYVENDSSTHQDISSSTQEVTPNTLLTTATTTYDNGVIWLDVVEKFSALDKGELNLIKGSKIKFLKFVDSFWGEGESSDGNVGIFPVTFVSLTPQLERDLKEISSKEESAVVSKNDKEECSFSSNNKKKTNEETVNEDVAKTNLVKNKSTNKEQDIGNTTAIAAEYEIHQKAVALYDYISSEPGDLNFYAGQEIILTEKIDENWSRGRIGDVVGMFALSYVEIIKDESEKLDEDANIDIISVTKLKNEPKNDINNVLTKNADLNIKKEINHGNVNNDRTNSEVIKPLAKKKLPPSRPKAPMLKKEEDLLASYVFNTQIQPYVIIPFKYRVADHVTMIKLKKPN